MTIFLCEDTPESVFCGVYEAWLSRIGHEHIRIEVEQNQTLQLFCQYEKVKLDLEKTKKVMDAIEKKISKEVQQILYYVALSNDTNKGEKIHRFLMLGFRYGSNIRHMIHLQEVSDVMNLYGSVWQECHRFLGIVRFKKGVGESYIATIAPKHDVITLLSPHFTNRFRCENWVLYDELRKKSVVHQKEKSWFIYTSDLWNWEKEEKNLKKDEFEDLWKVFFESISIPDRENKACQRGHLPYGYRKNMTEFI